MSSSDPVRGHRGGTSYMIDSVQDGSGNERLRVEALLSGVATETVAFDKNNDTVLTYGTTVAGDTSGTPASNTRVGLHVDANGNTIAVGAAAAGAAISGNPVQVGGSDGTNARALSTDASGNLNTKPTGNVASGASDAGNPVKVGGVFNTAQPTVTTGQRVDLQSTARGAQIVAPGVDNTAANAWFAKATDGTNTAAVKAASTAAAATDPALVVAVSPNNSIGTSPFIPTAANILIGQVAQTATTAAATIITISSGRTWYGTITVVCDVANVGAGTAVGQALATIATAGTNVTPAAGTIATCEARCGANVAAGVTGDQGNDSATFGPMWISAGASSATITLASTQAGTNSRVAATCAGIML